MENMMKKIILSLFDFTTNMVKPWAQNGYTCYCVDTQHDPTISYQDNIIRINTDINYYRPNLQNVSIVFAFPPCTDTAVSGALHMKNKGLNRLIDALELWKSAIEIVETLNCPWMIENPVTTISSYWRKPDYSFHPWNYGDLYTKKNVYLVR